MTAEKVLDQARAWIGKKESDGSHHMIVDIYNSHKPLAQGYKMSYNESWCATFISALAIECGCTDIIPTECSCQRQINLFKQLGEWQENEAITPKPGYVIYYDWQDNGRGDNTGWSDHVGIVEKVSGGQITVIEGNYNDAVGRRIIAVNGRYIRGYGIPKYEEEKKEEPVKVETPVQTVNTTTRYFKLNESMNMRKTMNGTIICAIPANTIISGDKLQTASNGVQWLETSYNGKSGLVAVLPASKKWATEVNAPVAEENNNNYYHRYAGTSNSIVDICASLGINSSFATRKQLAKANGINAYLGTASQNMKLVTLAKEGKLIKI